jgi:hypothetical protein
MFELSRLSQLPWEVQMEMLRRLPVKDVLAFCASDKKHREACWSKRGVRFLLDTPSAYTLTLRKISQLSPDRGWKILSDIYGADTPLWQATENLFYNFRFLVQDPDEERAFRKYLSTVLENSKIARHFGKEKKLVAPDDYRDAFRVLKTFYTKHAATEPAHPYYAPRQSQEKKYDMSKVDQFLSSYGRATVRSLLRQKPLEEELSPLIQSYLGKPGLLS